MACAFMTCVNACFGAVPGLTSAKSACSKSVDRVSRLHHGSHYNDL
jgi:hypothetical protein